MNAKRIVSLLIAMLILMSMFTACGKKEKEPNDSSSSNDGNVTEELKKTLNFNGEEIFIVIPPGFGYIDEEGKDPYFRRRNQRVEELNEKYNVKLTYKEGKGMYWNMMVTSILSGEPEGHIMLTNWNHMMSWYQADAFADLSEAMKKTGIDFKDSRYNQLVRKQGSLDNKNVLFCEAPIHAGTELWVYNKRIFEEQKLGNPYEMIEKGEWTWDKVDEIATKSTKKRADGTVEQWGLASSMHTSLWTSLLGSNGGKFTVLDEKGPQIMFGEPIAMKALEKFYDWTVVKKIATVNGGDKSWDSVCYDFAKGNIAMATVPNKFFSIASEVKMKDDFGLILPPKGPDATDYYIGETGGDYYFIPKTHENKADKLLLLIDELYAPYPDATQEDLIAEKYAGLLRSEESLNMYIKLVTKANVVAKDNNDIDFSSLLGISWSEPSLHQMMSDILKGTATPSEAIGKYKSLFQTAMYDAWGNMKYTAN